MTVLDKMKKVGSALKSAFQYVVSFVKATAPEAIVVGTVIGNPEVVAAAKAANIAASGAQALINAVNHSEESGLNKQSGAEIVSSAANLAGVIAKDVNANGVARIADKVSNVAHEVSGK